MFVRNGFTDGNGCACTIYDPPWTVPSICSFKTDMFGRGVEIVRYSHIQTLNQITELRIGLQKVEEELMAAQKALAEEEAAKNKKAKKADGGPAAPPQGQASARIQPPAGR